MARLQHLPITADGIKASSSCAHVGMAESSWRSCSPPRPGRCRQGESPPRQFRLPEFRSGSFPGRCGNCPRRRHGSSAEHRRTRQDGRFRREVPGPSKHGRSYRVPEPRSSRNSRCRSGPRRVNPCQVHPHRLAEPERLAISQVIPQSVFLRQLGDGSRALIPAGCSPVGIPFRRRADFRPALTGARGTRHGFRGAGAVRSRPCRNPYAFAAP